MANNALIWGLAVLTSRKPWLLFASLVVFQCYSSYAEHRNYMIIYLAFLVSSLQQKLQYFYQQHFQFFAQGKAPCPGEVIQLRHNPSQQLVAIINRHRQVFAIALLHKHLKKKSAALHVEKRKREKDKSKKLNSPGDAEAYITARVTSNVLTAVSCT